MTEITKASVFRKSESFVETSVDEETVLMDIEDGSFSSLVETGQVIWNLLDGKNSMANIVDQLTQEYDVPVDQCCDQVADLLSILLNKGLIQTA